MPVEEDIVPLLVYQNHPIDMDGCEQYTCYGLTPMYNGELLLFYWFGADPVKGLYVSLTPVVLGCIFPCQHAYGM